MTNKQKFLQITLVSAALILMLMSVASALPALTLTKIPNSLTYADGQSITYTYLITNIGNVTLSNIGVADNLTGLITLNVTTLAPGQQATGICSYLTTQSDYNNGFVTNTATVYNGTTPFNQATATITAINKYPALTLTKVPNTSTYTDGQSITYTYLITNIGNVTLTNINVNDNILGPITLSSTTLAPGQQATGICSYLTTQSDYDNGSVTNTATVYNGTTPFNQATATITAINKYPALTITKSASPTTYATVGQTITYTYTVTNSGNVNITGPINIIDSRINGLISIYNTDLGPGQSVIGTENYTITQTDIDAGSVTNSAYASNNNTNSNTVNVTVNATQQVIPIIIWNNPADIVYGTPLSNTQLDANASVPGKFVYTPAAGTILSAGLGQTLSTIFTPTDIGNYTTATVSVSINVTQSTPIITWSNPADIIYGTALSSGGHGGHGGHGGQLNAIASDPVSGNPLDGSFVYTPAAGTILSAGLGQTLNTIFTPTDIGNYTTATDSVLINVINVTQSTPIITWSNPADIIYGTALSSGGHGGHGGFGHGGQLNAIASDPVSGNPLDGSFVYTPAAGTILSAGLGQTLSTIFTPTDIENYTTATDSVLINVTQSTPIITWSNPADITYGTALSSTQLDANASNTVSGDTVPGNFIYTPPLGTVLNVGTQTLNVDFTPTDTTNYTTATANVSINVNALPPSVQNVTLIPNLPVVGQPLSVIVQVQNSPPDGSVQVIVNNNSGKIATIDNTGNATISELTVPTAGLNLFDVGILNSAGVKITDNVYTFTAVLPSPTITWNSPADITYGTPLNSTQLDATASDPLSGATVSGTFVYTPPAGTVLSTGMHTLNVSFTPTDIMNYANASASVSINVSVLGTFVYIPPSGTLLSAGIDTLNVSFIPTDTANYTTASATTSIDVTKVTPTITWNNPANIVYGTPLNSTQLNANASVPGTFVYTPSSGTKLVAGINTLNASFTPTDTTNYTKASASVLINITQATPTISWSNPTNITFGTPLNSAQLDATASNVVSGVKVPGTFVYTPPSGTVLGAGTYTLDASFTPTDTTDYTNASASALVNVTQKTPRIIWNKPANITYGTTLNNTQLDATVSAP